MYIILRTLTRHRRTSMFFLRMGRSDGVHGSLQLFAFSFPTPIFFRRPWTGAPRRFSLDWRGTQEAQMRSRGGFVPQPQVIWTMLCTPRMHHRSQPSRNPGESGVYLLAFEKHAKTQRFSRVGGRGGLPFKSFKDI